MNSDKLIRHLAAFVRNIEVVLAPGNRINSPMKNHESQLRGPLLIMFMPRKCGQNKRVQIPERGSCVKIQTRKERIKKFRNSAEIINWGP